MTKTSEKKAWLPDCVYTGERFERGLALVCDDAGRIARLAPANQVSCEVVRLRNRAMLPGMINTHSHAFQRVIRGRTEHRSNNSTDSFWTWRDKMYSAANRLGPEDIFDASRMAFLEMALGGITAVGEFHYLHNAAGGKRYDDPNLLAKEVIRAARDVGIRIALLRVAYARSGFHVDANERQKRFIESDPQEYVGNVQKLIVDIATESSVEDVWVGLAPHSVRALPLPYLREVIRFSDEKSLQVHMHVAEQPAENEACRAEHGKSVVALLADENILSERFTCVHAVHITNVEAQAIGNAHSMVCACPTTERNLGDGVVPADLLINNGVRIAFGTDSHAQIDILDDARQLELNLRLLKLQRNVLAQDGDEISALAGRLFDGATIHGAASIGAKSGSLEPGLMADFFTVDVDDPSIAGASNEDLLSNIVFSMTRSAVQDVYVGGQPVVVEGRHDAQAEIVDRFRALQTRFWD